MPITDDTSNKKGWPKGLIKRGDTYWFTRMIKGHYLRESLNTSSEQDAIKLASNLNYDISRGVDIVKSFETKKDEEKKQRNTFFALAELFINEKSNDGLKAGSIKGYKACINNFLEFLEKFNVADSILQVTPEIALKYKFYRQENAITKNGHKNSKQYIGVKKKTLKDDIRLLKSLFQFGVRLKWITENPFSDVKSGKAEKKSFRFLDSKEIEIFLNGALAYDDTIRKSGRKWGNMLYEIFYTYLKTGLRETELLVLEWSDIDFTNKTLSIKKKNYRDTRVIKINEADLASLKKLHDEDMLDLTIKNGLNTLPSFILEDEDILLNLKEKNIDWKKGVLSYSAVKNWSPKGNEGEIPLSPNLLKLFKKCKSERGTFSNFIFPGTDGGMLRIQLRLKLIDIAEACNIPNFTKLHSLRHTFATQLRKQGVPIETLKELLRHSDIRETMIYAHYEKEEGEKAVIKLDDIF